MVQWIDRLLQRLHNHSLTSAAPHSSVAEKRRRLGQRSERLARHFLEAHGYRIERTNVRFPVGEIDIVARDRATLCFVEVRSTTSMRWGGPLETITGRKRLRMLRAARWYLNGYRAVPLETRFDVVAVCWTDATTPTCELVKGVILEG